MLKKDYLNMLSGKVERKKLDFKEENGYDATHLKMGFFVDLMGGKNVFSDGEEFCGLSIKRIEDEAVVLEVF